MNCDLEKFKANIEVLDFFYKKSSLVLFFLSPNHLLSIGNSLYMLQLTVIDQETREKLYSQVYKQLQLASMEENASKEPTSKPSGSSDSIVTTIGKTLLSNMIGGCYSVLESNFKNLVSSASSLYSASSKKSQDFYFGSSIYDKLYFVINKIDTVKNTNYCYFELGCSIGRNFKFLPLPTSSRVLNIGCPNEIRNQVALNSNIPRRDVNIDHINLGDLQQLERIMDALRDEKQMQLTYINHIQHIFEKIQQKHQSLGYYNQYMYSKAFERAKIICDLCCEMPTQDEDQ